MAVGFRWMPFGAVALACVAKPADPPPSEPSRGVEVAPVILPEPPGSASAAAPQEPSPVASTPTTVPTVRVGPIHTEPEKKTGRLPPEVIQKIVRENYGTFRKCYEAGLGRNRDLRGRVSARFVIERAGTVSNVTNGGSDMPDPEVTACILTAFHGLRFPQPEGNRDGRLSDHARARIAAAALRNRLEPLNNRSGRLVLSSARSRSILGALVENLE